MLKIRKMLPSFHGAIVVLAMAVPLGVVHAADETWYPYPVEVWDPPFDMSSPRHEMQYEPLEKASQPWNICVSLPHLKDPYWQAVNYGVIQEARRLGISLTVYEAGGYNNLSTQISQIEDCVSNGARAVVVGAISGEGLNNLVHELTEDGVPVVDFMNGMSSSEIAAKSLVSFGEMGEAVGRYLAERHPAGSGKVRAAWFPGPAGASWVESGNRGFKAALEGSDVEVVATRYGDTGKGEQLRLVEDVLATEQDIDYIAGTSPTVEAAAQVLRLRGLDDRIDVLSYYFTPGVFELMKRGRVLAAPTDSTVIQARIAIDQAVRIVEGKDYTKHVGPRLQMIEAAGLDEFDRGTTLAPQGYRPVFSVN